MSIIAVKAWLLFANIRCALGWHSPSDWAPRCTNCGARTVR